MVIISPICGTSYSVRYYRGGAAWAAAIRATDLPDTTLPRRCFVADDQGSEVANAPLTRTREPHRGGLGGDGVGGAVGGIG